MSVNITNLIKDLEGSLPAAIAGCIGYGAYSYFTAPNIGYTDHSLTDGITGCIEGALTGASMKVIYDTFMEHN
jgi:hypothetical protein